MSDKADEPIVPTGPTTDHASYLGGSDIAAALGISPYRTPLDVWAEKVHGLSSAESEAMRTGKLLERPVLELLYAPPRNLSLWYPGTMLHPSEPWAGATPDAFAGPEGKQSDRGVECKIVGIRQYRRWGDPEDGPDGIPPEVFTQAIWQLAMIRAQDVPCAFESAEVGALVGTELRVYGVAFDADFAANLMEAGRAWWKRHIEGRRMPEVYTEDTRRVLTKIQPKPVQGVLEMTVDARELIDGWFISKAAEDEAKQQKEALAAELCALMGDAAGFEGDGLRALWSPRRGSISYKAIVEALGVPQSEREKYRGEPSRMLRITDNREGEKNE